MKRAAAARQTPAPGKSTTAAKMDAQVMSCRPAGNPIYRLFQIVTRPVIVLTRRLLPKAVLDRHVPVVAFFLSFWLWIVLAYVKRVLCGMHGLAACCNRCQASG